MGSTQNIRIINGALVVVLVGIMTQTILNGLYGEPAPITPSNTTINPNLLATTPSLPNWLADDSVNTGAGSALTLVGVVVEGKTGYALLQNNTQKEQRAKLLRVGAILSDGSKLLVVHQKSATLSKDGVETVLTLAPPSSNTASAITNTITNTINNNNNNNQNNQSLIGKEGIPIPTSNDAALQAQVQAQMQTQQQMQLQLQQQAQLQQAQQEQALVQAATQAQAAH